MLTPRVTICTCFKEEEGRKKQARSNKQGKATQHTQACIYMHTACLPPGCVGPKEWFIWSTVGVISGEQKRLLLCSSKTEYMVHGTVVRHNCYTHSLTSLVPRRSPHAFTHASCVYHLTLNFVLVQKNLKNWIVISLRVSSKVIE